MKYKIHAWEVFQNGKSKFKGYTEMKKRNRKAFFEFLI